MNIETLKELTGWKRPTINPTPTDLEIALARVNADHKSVLVAVKLLTEAVQSNAAANLNMTVVHEERHAYVIKAVRELKKEVTAADSRHLAAFELALRPVLRAIEEMSNRLSERVASLDADIHDLKADRHDELDAHTYVLNTKLTLVSGRIDDLCKILDDLVKNIGLKLVQPPKSVTVAPPKPKKKQGRRTGDKNRTLEQRYEFLSDRVQRARPGSKTGAKFRFMLNELRVKMGVDK